MQGICHHSPREALFIDGPSTFLDIATHQGFTARNDNEHLVGIGFGSDTIKDTEEVLFRHIATFRLHLTVAATVPAFQVAAQGTLPEQLF